MIPGLMLWMKYELVSLRIPSSKSLIHVGDSANNDKNIDKNNVNNHNGNNINVNSASK